MNEIIQRRLFIPLAKHLKEKEITIIIGPRQVGKTTILNLLKEDLGKSFKVGKENIFYFNLDRITDFEFFKSQEEIIKFLRSFAPRDKIFLFIDEAQRVENSGRFFKGIYDLNFPVKFILTGSSSLELKAKFQEFLTGRKRLFYLWPLDFEEFIGFKSPRLKDLLRNKNVSSYDLNAIFDILKEFMVFGGYPRQALATDYGDRKSLIEEIYNSYVEKDVVNFLKIKNVFNYSKLVRTLASQTSGILNINELSAVLETERKTVQHYLNILEETFIIRLVRPFFRNSLKELRKSPKIFFVDNGLRNYAIDNLKTYDERLDKGAILENFVFTELFKKFGGSAHYWRTIGGQEVDFVVEKEKNLVPIEVKSALSDAKIPAGIRNFINDYRPSKAYVVNLKVKEKVNFNGVPVEFIYPFEINDAI